MSELLSAAQRDELAGNLVDNMFNVDPAVRVPRERIAEALRYVDTRHPNWGYHALLLAQGNPGLPPGALLSGVDVARAFAAFARAPGLDLTGTNVGKHVVPEVEAHSLGPGMVRLQVLDAGPSAGRVDLIVGPVSGREAEDLVPGASGFVPATAAAAAPPAGGRDLAGVALAGLAGLVLVAGAYALHRAGVLD